LKASFDAPPAQILLVQDRIVAVCRDNAVTLLLRNE
jgi:hypothetical protein